MQNEELFKQIVAKNLTKYRKINNLTQLDLAEKIAYSDKAISKWERGESLPDVYTLSILAEFYGITLLDLCQENNEPIKIKTTNKTNHLFITLLSIGLVWFVATLLFVILKLIPKTESSALWMIYIYAIPITFIVLCVFSSLWYNNVMRFFSVSGIVWGLALTLQLIFNLCNFKNAGLIYIIAIPFQILVILWYTMFSVQAKLKKKDKN